MSKSYRALVAAAVLLGLTSPLAAQPQSGQPLLDFVRDAHRATRESIRTLSCRVTYKGKVAQRPDVPPDGSDDLQSSSGSYWYSPDAVRARVSEFGREEDSLWKDSIRKIVQRRTENGKPQVAAGRMSAGSRYLGPHNPWSGGLLVLSLPNAVEYIPFERFIERATRFTGAQRISVSGRELIMTRFHFDGPKEITAGWDIEIYFDPSVNYLIRKDSCTSVRPGKGRYEEEMEVTEFTEYAPGLFFPTHAAGWSGTKDNPDFTCAVELADVRVNQPLPHGIFDFQYPSGIYLVDSIRGTTYNADSAGNAISKETALTKQPPPPPANAAAPPGPGRETLDEPRSVARWILPASLGVLLLAGVAALVRRRRLASTDNG